MSAEQRCELENHMCRAFDTLIAMPEYGGKCVPLAIPAPRNCSWGPRNIYYCKSLWLMFPGKHQPVCHGPR
jgi:hypothetical protein